MKHIFDIDGFCEVMKHIFDMDGLYELKKTKKKVTDHFCHKVDILLQQIHSACKFTYTNEYQ